MSTNIFNRDDGNKSQSYAQIDQDFDNYWEIESRNPVKHRIRIGRQYQAIVPSLAKSTVPDRQKYQESTCHRETLKWTPKHAPNEQQLKQYLVLARAVSMFSKVVRNDDSNDETGSNQERNEPTAKESGETADNLKDEDPDILNKFKLIFRGLSQFVNAHHPSQAGDSNCKLLRRTKNELNDETATGDESPADADKSLDEPNLLNILPASEWTETECILFAAALQACGQNFSTIKREFLPWKNCKNIIDYYHLCLNQQSDTSQTSSNRNQQTNSIEDERKKCAELRNKLDARSADGKDAKLRQCSVDINNIILDLIRANSGHNQALRESNRKNQQIVNNKDNDSNDGSPNGSSFSSSLSGSLPSSVTRSLNLRTSRSSAKTNSSNEDKTSGGAKEQTTTEKRTSKSFKPNFDKKTSPRNKSSQNQTAAWSNNESATGKPEPKDQYEFDDQQETESLGSLKFYKDGQLVLKLKGKQPANANKCQWEESADSAELGTKSGCKKKRLESNRAREPLERNKQQSTNADENQGDDSPFESEDSRGSSEFSLQKPLTGLFKKAKVKVENNYFPLPSLNSASKDDESDLEPNNRKSISPNDSKLNGDDLKRKLRTPKSATKKSKVLKLNECTNKLNISPDLIQQQLNSFNTTPSSNPLVDQLTLLSSLPLDVRQKLISDSLLKNNRLNELNGLNSLINSSVPINADNAFLENIDKIKVRNQIECLMSNLNALIEADQLK